MTTNQLKADLEPAEPAERIDKSVVLWALQGVVDPELGINIVDLGLVYDVRIDGTKVGVDMTLTTPGCPLHNTLVDWAEATLQNLAGVTEATVNLVWSPPWTPDRVSKAALKQLGGGRQR